MEDKFKLKLHLCIYLHISNTEYGNENPLHSLLRLSVRQEFQKLGWDLQDRGKVTSNLKILFKFYNDTTHFAWVLDFLMPVSLNRSLTLLQC